MLLCGLAALLPALAGALSLPPPLPRALAPTLRCPFMKPSGVEPFGNCSCHAFWSGNGGGRSLVDTRFVCDLDFSLPVPFIGTRLW